MISDESRHAVKDIPIKDVLQYFGIEITNNKMSCPHPDHTDTNPSAWINDDANVVFCPVCGDANLKSNFDTIDVYRMLSGTLHNRKLSYPVIVTELLERFTGSKPIQAAPKPSSSFTKPIVTKDIQKKVADYLTGATNIGSADYKYLNSRGIFWENTYVLNREQFVTVKDYDKAVALLKTPETLTDSDTDKYRQMVHIKENGSLVAGVGKLLVRNGIRLYHANYDVPSILFHMQYNENRPFDQHTSADKQDFIISRSIEAGTNFKKSIGTTDFKAIFYEMPKYQYITTNIYIVEGIFDAMALLSCGKNVICLNSTINRNKLIQYIENISPDRYHFILALDNDDAGRNATEFIADFFNQNHYKYQISKVLEAQNCKDYNELYCKQLFKE